MTQVPVPDRQRGAFLDFDSGYNRAADDYDKPETGKVAEFVEALRQIAPAYMDADVDEVIQKIYLKAVDNGGLASEKLEEIVREDEKFNYALDPETGELAASEIFRQALAAIGYDEVIDWRLFDESQHPRDEHGRFATVGGTDDTAAAPAAPAPKPEPITAFVSPNVGKLTFEQATQAVNSERQQALRSIAGYIDNKLGTSTRTKSTIGAWADGAENSLSVTMKDVSWDQARAIAAMEGHLANQKQVLVFQPQRDGDHLLVTFEAKGNLADIHRHLLQDGVAFHTLELSKDGAKVSVFADNQQAIDAIKKVADRYDPKPQYVTGRGEFLGTQLGDEAGDEAQRADARGAYEKVLKEIGDSGQLGGRDLGSAWGQVRDHWTRITQAIEIGVGADRPEVPGYSRGVKAHGTEAANQTKAAWVKASPFLGEHLDEAMAAAVPAQAALSGAGRAIEQALPGVKFKDPGAKVGVARIREKYAKYDNNAARISDLARATFIIERPEQAEQIAKILGERFGVAVEDWRSLPQFYTDKTMSIRFSNGLLGEIQFMDPGMAWAKSKDGGGGHDMYTEMRKLDPKNHPEQRDRFNELILKMKLLYGKVLQNEFWQEAHKEGVTYLN